MIGKETLERKPIPLSHVKDWLAKRADAGGDATYEQTQTMEYVTKFTKLDGDKAESLLNNLMNINGMTDEIAVKLVDFLPEDEESVKQLLPKANALDDGQVSEALALVKKHANA